MEAYNGNQQILMVLEWVEAPAVLALVLGSLAEQHLRRALSVSNGDLMTFVERPISLTLLVFILLVLVLPPAIRLLLTRQAGRHRVGTQAGRDIK